MASEKGGQSYEQENQTDVDESTVESLGSTAAQAAQAEWTEDAVESIDDLLDAMEDILEENAEEFINAYKQKGGQ